MELLVVVPDFENLKISHPMMPVDYRKLWVFCVYKHRVARYQVASIKVLGILSIRARKITFFSVKLGQTHKQTRIIRKLYLY